MLGNDNLAAHRLKVILVFNRRGGTGLRKTVQRIGIETVLDPVQRLDQIRMANGVTDAQARQRPRFRQRVRHQQLRITADQRHHRLAAEVDVSLVDDHYRIAVGTQQALDVGDWHKASGRRIGLRKHDAAIGLQVIIDGDFKRGVQRYLFVGNAVEATVDRIKTVGDVRKQHRCLVFEQAEEHMRQYFIGAIADKHMIRCQAVTLGNRGAQAVAGRIRIQAQRVTDFSAQSLQHAAAGTIRAFIGVELDQIGQLRLLARHIRREPLHHIAPVTAHDGFENE